MEGIPSPVESVCLDAARAVAGQPAVLANMALANAVAFQHAAQAQILTQMSANAQLSQTISARGVNEVLSTPMQEATANVKEGTGNDLAAQLAALGAAIAGIQQNIKGAQTTPPPTP